MRGWATRLLAALGLFAPAVSQVHARADEAAMSATWAWCERGDDAARCANFTAAIDYYRRALEDDPLDELVLLKLAQAEIATGDVATAARTLALHPGGPAADRARAEIALAEGRFGAAWMLASSAQQRGPHDAALCETAARAAYHVGDLARSRQLYARAVRLDPRHEWAHIRLGSGFSPRGELPPLAEARERTVFSAGMVAWQRGDLAAAEAAFADWVAWQPLAARPHLLLGLVLREARWDAEVPFGSGCEQLYRLRPAPPVPHEAQFVPGFAKLLPEQRHVVRVALAPMSRWMARLVKAGARHDILPLDVALADDETRTHLAGQLTFDGRWYAHLRAVGGRHGATGQELLRAAALFEFHTFAHEAAHQLLTYALTPYWHEQVAACYKEALAAGRCLDSYAASNVDEYFAQGYEAWISFHKRPGLRDTAQHTRAELQARDPALAELLGRLLSVEHETPTAMANYMAAMNVCCPEPAPSGPAAR